MPDNSTAEIETKEKEPIATPLRDTDSIQGATYDKKVREWMDYQNRNNNSDTQGK